MMKSPRLSRFAGFILCLWLGPLAAQSGGLDAIRTLVAQGSHEAALAQLRERMNQSGASVEARLLEGVILTHLNRPADAINAFRALADAEPDLAEPHNNLAVLYAKTGQFDAARQALERAVELQPGYGVAHENLGDVYAKLASLAYERAARLGGSNRASSKARVVGTLLDPEERAAAPAGPADSTVQASASTAPQSRQAAALTPDATTYTPVPKVEPVGSGSGSTAGAGAECLSITGFENTGQREQGLAWLYDRGAKAPAGAPNASAATYMIYLPPAANREAAEQAVNALRSQGIRDLLRIPNGPLTNGISLGVYSSEQGAVRRQQQVQALGYENVRIQGRGTTEGTGRSLVLAATVTPSTAQAFAAAFPAARLEPWACN